MTVLFPDINNVRLVLNTEHMLTEADNAQSSDPAKAEKLYSKVRGMAEEYLESSSNKDPGITAKMLLIWLNCWRSGGTPAHNAAKSIRMIEKYKSRCYPMDAEQFEKTLYSLRTVLLVENDPSKHPWLTKTEEDASSSDKIKSLRNELFFCQSKMADLMGQMSTVNDHIKSLISGLEDLE
tara:strand:+ start:2460 stop:2999 length:540 start_codon:yes stop_codon:yes gene_type:complete